MKAITYIMDKTNKQLQDITYLLKCFYYSSNISVYLVKDNKTIFSLPENNITAKQLTKDLNPEYQIIQNEKSISIIQNKYKELFFRIELNKDNYYAIIGPFITNKIETGELTNMVRNSIIPFHQKTQLENYYNSLPILDKEKVFYTIKILEHIFLNKNSNYSSENENEIIYDIENLQYNKQKNEYRKNAFLHSPYFIEQEISKHISNGDFNKSKQLLKEINLMPHAKLASSSLRSYKNSMICSCSYMTRAAIAGGVNPDDAFTLSDTYINEIENISSLDELEAFEIKMVEGFSSRVRKTKTQSYTKPVLNCIYYIDNHLCDDLNINILANEVYLNPSYLSNLFHKETGKKLSEWILEKRIIESSHLVQNTNDDFAEIAFFYKFCSQSYYVQCFKKIMGVTPGEYRKSYAK